MDTPFKVIFIQEEKEHLLSPFYKEEKEWYASSVPRIQLKENMKLYVKFQCEDETARLYMDGLDTLPNEYVEIDEAGCACLIPSNQEVPLFVEQYYPFVPAIYQVTIHMRGEKYISSIQIVPKLLSQAQWETMRDEVEQALRGLAQEFILRKRGVQQTISEFIPLKYILQFFILKKHYPHLMASLYDLYIRANYRIRRDYCLSSSERAKKMDEETVRYWLRHPDKKDTQLKTAVYKLDYDLPENRWLIKMIRFFIDCLTAFITSVLHTAQQIEKRLEEDLPYQDKTNVKISIQQNVQKRDELLNYLNQAKKMKEGFETIRRAEWYSEVSSTHVIPMTHILHSDMRYRNLYQVFRKLTQEEIGLNFDRQFSFLWKRTETLYEIWGFLKVAQLLQRMGYQAIQGWIYDADFERDQWLIPMIPPGTKIVLKQDQITLHLIYDGYLPSRSEQTTIDDNPLFTTSLHNRPDGRIDVFQNQEYMGSLIFDCKYQPIHHIWNMGRIDWRRPRAMNQLIGYSHCRSPFLWSSVRRNINTISPVLEVWALHPSYDGSQVKYYQDYNLRLIPVIPGNDHTTLHSELTKVIEKILKSKESLL